MHKVYILLRNNKKSGPYTLEELVATGLKPFDLIWVEGRSAGWCYPSEIESLKPYLSSTGGGASSPKTEKTFPPQPSQHQAYMPPEKETPPSSHKAHSSRKIYVNMPNNAMKQQVIVEETAPAASLEQKAEELRRRIQAYSAENKTIPSGNSALPAKYTPAYTDEMEEDTSWKYSYPPKRKRRLSKKKIATAIIMVLLLVVGFVTIKNRLQRKEPKATLAIKTQPAETNLQPVTADPETVPPQTTDIENIPSANMNSALDVNHNEPVNSAPQKNAPATVKQTTAKTSTPAAKGTENEKMKTQTAADKTAVTKEVTKDEEEVAATTPQKKKKLGEKMDGFLDQFKRKKTGTTAEEQQKPVSGQEASKRKLSPKEEATTSVPENVNPADFIDVTKKETQDNWMMGVHGLKFTLRNRGNEVLKTAIEVRYYNEQNELLQKKVLNVANIPPKKSVTVSAPDHRLADHTDYQLLTVSSQ
jgi:hypothetical protein